MLQLPWVTARMARGGQYTAGPAAPSDTAQVTLQDNIVHWWKLQDDTATVGGEALTRNNQTSIASGEGPDGNDCYEFDGTGDTAESAEFDYGTLDAISMSCWVKSFYTAANEGHNYSSSSAAFPRLYDASGHFDNDYALKWGPYSYTAGFLSQTLMYITSGGSQTLLTMTPYIEWSTNTFPTTCGSGTKVAFNPTGSAPASGGSDTGQGEGNWSTRNWNHMAVTWESGVAMKFYVNGQLQGTDDTTTTGTLSNKDGTTSGSKLFLGRADFYGQQADVRVYDIALTQSNCADIWNSGAGDFV